MFGIGKKKEAEKVATKEAEKGASDEIQFDFEEDDKLPFDDEGFDDEYVEEEESPPRRQSLSQRTLLLGLLLLLALGAGGYYYLNSTPAPLPKPAAPVKATVSVQPVAPTAPTTAVEVKPVNPVPAAGTPVKEQPASVVKEQAVPAAKTAAAVKTPAPTATVAVPSEDKGEVTVAPATRQPFTLSAGAFLAQEHQQEVVKKIRRLGYTPKVQTTYSMVPMTRLLLGVYDNPAAAQARSREISALIPQLFSMKQGEKIALYAGSYQDIDQARRFADKLYQQGILADEETVSLRMPLKKISFGSFSTRAAAEKAAKRAAAAGLSAQVVKR